MTTVTAAREDLKTDEANSRAANGASMSGSALA